MKKSWMMLAALPVLLAVTSCQKSIDAGDLNRTPEALKSGNATVFTRTVQLSGAEEVPPVMTTTTGVAILRLTADGTLHTRINISNLEPGDELLFAHIHFGARGTNGGVFLGIADNAMDFNKNMMFKLSPTQVQTLLNDPLYVNAHSKKYPPGVVRGQIR